MAIGHPGLSSPPRWGDTLLPESDVQEVPEGVYGQGAGERPTVNEERGRALDTGLPPEADIGPDVVVAPTSLDAGIETPHIQVLFSCHDREDRLRVVRVPPAPLLTKKGSLHREEPVLLTGAFSRDGGFQTIGELAQNERNEFPFHQTRIDVDLLQNRVGVEVETGTVSTSEIAELQHLEGSIGRALVVAHLCDPKRARCLFLRGDSGARRGIGAFCSGPKDGLYHRVSCFGFRLTLCIVLSAAPWQEGKQERQG